MDLYFRDCLVTKLWNVLAMSTSRYVAHTQPTTKPETFTTHTYTTDDDKIVISDIFGVALYYKYWYNTVDNPPPPLHPNTLRTRLVSWSEEKCQRLIREYVFNIWKYAGINSLARHNCVNHSSELIFHLLWDALFSNVGFTISHNIGY